MQPIIPYRDILDCSPAEISVINMAPGKNQFDIIYINRTKAENLQISAESAVGKKCHLVFESLRLPADRQNGFCVGCPSWEAFEKNGREIHRDWRYIHPVSNQIRIVNITARRIPQTDNVIEICRDNTMRRRISEMTSLLSQVESYQQIEELIHTGLLSWLYFDRCRFYRISNNGRELVLKSFKKGVPTSERTGERQLLDVATGDVVLTKENSTADKALLEKKDGTPKLFFISDIIDQNQIPHSRFQNAVLLGQCHSTMQLEKQHYPIWLDLPISASGKIVGKISMDMALPPIDGDRWTIADYEIESLELLAKSIGQAWENVRLLDVDELRKIDKIVWVSKGADLRGVLYQILTSTCSYLGFEQSHIALDNGNATVAIVGRDYGETGRLRTLAFADSICGNVIEKYLKDRDEMPSIFDPVNEEMRRAFQDIGDRDIGAVREVKSCLVAPLIDDDGVLVGAWYLGERKITNVQRISHRSHPSDLSAYGGRSTPGAGGQRA